MQRLQIEQQHQQCRSSQESNHEEGIVENSNAVNTKKGYTNVFLYIDQSSIIYNVSLLLRYCCITRFFIISNTKFWLKLEVA